MKEEQAVSELVSYVLENQVRRGFLYICLGLLFMTPLLIDPERMGLAILMVGMAPALGVASIAWGIWVIGCSFVNAERGK